ncbi:glutamate synthase (NADPH) large subunit [Thermaerobacter marianensis DSM 12885]|uniref:Glutamate synthase (NADPH) large subunit n=1 Tax=Thermaerobacter marianensis (strain ATCC 700841 / DSM 12885 / JCM 10246 / 7p75a) TaxID=644966 RepID=E6SHQ5_THEM7|nr:glutamate synthase-related protein [Thermaerobacter marianensis]ADU50752.1 glutamate synthase (NADPH) large subunit [Thermaerobacter marianensis DSM 12885]
MHPNPRDHRPTYDGSNAPGRLPEHDACGVGFVATLSGRPDPDLVGLGLEALRRLRHRGGVAADGITGDGAGVMTEIPRRLLTRELATRGVRLPAGDDFALAACFFPTAPEAEDRAQRLLEEVCRQHGLEVLAWRPVPVDPAVLGPIAAASRPALWHAVIVRGPRVAPGLAFDRALYLARRAFERRAAAFVQQEERDGSPATGPAAGPAPAGLRKPYIASMSSRTVVYKGLLMAGDLDRFYLDLRHPDFATRFVIFHQRYSTNTTPTWERAQPFRLLGHNGEINTLQGNVNRIAACEPWLRVPGWPEFEPQAVAPVIDPEGSDSAMLDNVLELLVLAGRDPLHALMMLVPEAWEKVADLPPALRDFYRFHACLTEPWDGPAALIFSDGRWVGARLDRNGLRPIRYTVLKNGLVVAASEAGVVDADPAQVEEHGKLGPGQMIAVDLATGRFLRDEEVKAEVASRRPYGRWVQKIVRYGEEPGGVDAAGAGPVPNGTAKAGHGAAAGPAPAPAARPLVPLAAFGWTREELTVIVRPMVETGKEPDGSMGDDTPHAVLSLVHRPLHHYFKQRFAQVTNPPIDHLREELVFSLTVRLGRHPNLLVEEPAQARVIELPGPVLTAQQMAWLRGLGRTAGFRLAELPTLFPATGPDALEPALDDLCRRAEAAVDAGSSILVLTDRGVDAEHAPIPALLAVGAVHHHLLRAGKRALASIVVESGEPRDVHHFATLIGYGASAVHPYLALAVARETGGAEGEANFVRAVESGLKKVMSKMGISTLDAYQGAQIFEAIGLDPAVVERCFTGTPCQVGGNRLRELAEDVLYWHRQAFPAEAGAAGAGAAGAGEPEAAAAGPQAAEAGLSGDTGRQAAGNAAPAPGGAAHGPAAAPALAETAADGYGFFKFKKDGELHEFSPEVVRALHEAVRARPGVLDGDFLATYEHYRRFSRLVHQRPPSQLRDLLDFRSDRAPVPLEEVEPVEAIVRRFSTGAMSVGSLSPEAHENLAVAMNRLGARSNSGEGGEDPARYGTERNSAVKQVASGRFGVTPAYLASAVEIQIKMAQGSKPGEGGQIPGHKVTELIARLRHTVPGVPLISPPPHHDIYSIEDLAQLIYDLKQANPEALISVKLVAETGVGIIAAGVAKGYADIVVISGHAGGTGSSPLSSIKHAGLPWELGLVETQAMLVATGLRGRVTVRVDGGLKTGRDVLVAALLGADEYSFGTSALVAEGCVMARACHTNTCPVGIATQAERLRQRFPGTPEHVMNYFLYMAQEVRELLARLGYRSLDEVIGRADLLVQRPSPLPRAERIDLGRLLRPAGQAPAAAVAAGTPPAVPPAVQGAAGESSRRDEPATPLRRVQLRNPLPEDDSLGRRIAADLAPFIQRRRPVRRSYTIRNTDRTVGATVAWEIARRYGDQGLPPGTLQLAFRGVAGQSFGAFCIRGMHLELTGLANDYVGKGMAGGEIVIRPEPGTPTDPARNVLVGNTVLYGATGGALFCAGAAGERLAVRNSGAVAVVEGAGDHACEYMTGGTVVILGPTGRNLGAGMTGGTAFVYDPHGALAVRHHGPSVELFRLPEVPSPAALEAARETLHGLLVLHARRTGSARARDLLARWEDVLPHFWWVVPRASRERILAETAATLPAVASGLD